MVSERGPDFLIFVFSLCVASFVLYLSVNFLGLDLTKLKIPDNHRMVTFDIKDLYVNIPIDETFNIIKN